MPDLPQFTAVVDAIVLPLLGSTLLLLAKTAHGEAARRAERQFFAVLVVMTLITLRTVIRCDQTWLLHTSTLAMMILGALVIPSQDASVAV